jgi:glycosyltransferase involved in cell wall biosynthesis
MPLSVAIITFNEERNISRCLESVQTIADEIIVVDSFSKDRTEEICRRYPVQFIQHPFAGHIEQKNYALEQTSYDYVLSLDADEALSPALQESILREKQKNFPSDAYRMNRCTNYCGQFIRHGLWYPDRKIRLINKHKGHWGGINPHDKIEMNPGSTITRLPGDILHYSYNSIREHTEQNELFSTISADALLKLGKKTNLLKIIIHPFWAFFSGYILRLGFLDGYYGWVIAKKIFTLTYLKHSKLYRKQREK